ncbi:hypothetical protein SAY87_028661 [Trapa incisa]|uniref:Uncharacterized protein n=1 Tax=Trapa incisa TaxID=236973 RepID=A0AAN7QPI5_9MYRT|nr:hypothetical protein SAY87_028661 [Trapa incisa]
MKMAMAAAPHVQARPLSRLTEEKKTANEMVESLLMCYNNTIQLTPSNSLSPKRSPFLSSASCSNLALHSNGFRANSPPKVNPRMEQQPIHGVSRRYISLWKIRIYASFICIDHLV